MISEDKVTFGERFLNWLNCRSAMIFFVDSQDILQCHGVAFYTSAPVYYVIRVRGLVTNAKLPVLVHKEKDAHKLGVHVWYLYSP